MDSRSADSDAPTLAEAVARVDALTAQLLSYIPEHERYLMELADMEPAVRAIPDPDHRARLAADLVRVMDGLISSLQEAAAVKLALVVLGEAGDNPTFRRAVVAAFGIGQGHGLN